MISRLRRAMHNLKRGRVKMSCLLPFLDGQFKMAWKVYSFNRATAKLDRSIFDLELRYEKEKLTYFASDRHERLGRLEKMLMLMLLTQRNMKRMEPQLVAEVSMKYLKLK